MKQTATNKPSHTHEHTHKHTHRHTHTHTHTLPVPFKNIPPYTFEFEYKLSILTKLYDNQLRKPNKIIKIDSKAYQFLELWRKTITTKQFTEKKGEKE